MIANISDYKYAVFISNYDMFSPEIKFSWLKKVISCYGCCFSGAMKIVFRGLFSDAEI